MARRFVDSLYAVGDNISKISTSCMIKMICCLLFQHKIRMLQKVIVCLCLDVKHL
jgi:hypothetical protein